MKRSIAVFGCLGSLIIGALAFAWIAWSFGAFEQPPQIARDLDSLGAFEARAEQAFPIGSSARQLRESLEAQGFEHGWTYDAETVAQWDLVEAMTWRGRGCNQYQVAFKADREGRLTWVHGAVPNMCY